MFSSSSNFDGIWMNFCVSLYTKEETNTMECIQLGMTRYRAGEISPQSILWNCSCFFPPSCVSLLLDAVFPTTAAWQTMLLVVKGLMIPRASYEMIYWWQQFNSRGMAEHRGSKKAPVLFCGSQRQPWGDSAQQDPPGVIQTPWCPNKQSLRVALHPSGVRGNMERLTQSSYDQRCPSFTVAARFPQQELRLQYSEILRTGNLQRDWFRIVG